LGKIDALGREIKALRAPSKSDKSDFDKQEERKSTKEKAARQLSVAALPRRGIRHHEESKLFSAGLAATYSPKP
jgi:hypothetical protein